MATKQRQEDWFTSAVGRGMNLDGVFGFQCVDVINDYGNFLFGNWQQTVGRGNAKDKYANMPDTYWQKIPNNPKDANLIPQRGDVIVWPAMTKINNPAGHIAVVVSANQKGVTVIEQDGFYPNRPAFQTTHPYLLQGVLPIGWLRPRLEQDIGGHDVTIDEYAADILDVIEASLITKNNSQQLSKGMLTGWWQTPHGTNAGNGSRASWLTMGC